MEQNQKIDIAHYQNALSRKHQLTRLLWGIVWPLGTWFLPRSMGMGWKRFLLRVFGAKIHPTANIYSSAKIYYPANLTMEEYSCPASKCLTLQNVAVSKYNYERRAAA